MTLTIYVEKVDAVVARALGWGRQNAVYAVYATRRHLAPKVRAFLDFLIEHWKDGDVPPGAQPSERDERANRGARYHRINRR